MDSNKKIFIIIVILILLGIWLKAKADQEPNWDTLIPIIIQIESNGDPNAVSKDGCIGLMQISPIMLKEYQETFKNDNFVQAMRFDSLFHPEINKDIGVWYLRRIWFRYLPYYEIPQTIDHLLIAYNFGIGNLVKYRQNKIKLPAETKNYLKKYYKLSKSK